MDKFIVNIIHRPEMVPEYSATVTGQGKEEDIGDKKLITESLDIFKTQQRLAHEAGLKTTIQIQKSFVLYFSLNSSHGSPRSESAISSPYFS